MIRCIHKEEQNKNNLKGIIKMTKLSKTMQAAYDKLISADWYYMHEGNDCTYISTDEGMRFNGAGAGRVEGGYVYTQISSNTLNALAKRGLIEIVIDGGRNTDIVKVVGVEAPKRIEKATMITVSRSCSGSRPVEFTVYVTGEKAIEHALNHFRGKNNAYDVSYKINGNSEVELTVWDYFAN